MNRYLDVFAHPFDRELNKSYILLREGSLASENSIGNEE